MPTHLLLEGPDIESVLTELRDSHGPDAKIVQAELVRSGGFAGFFARRRYEVTVEVDEQQLAAEAALATASPVRSGIDALLSAAEDGDHSLIAVPVRGIENDQVATVSAGPTSGAPQGWHRPVSTEGNAFSDVLDSLTQSLAEQQRDPEPPFEPFAAYGLPRPRVQPVEPTPSARLDPVDPLDPVDALDALDRSVVDPFDAFDVSPARPFVPPAVPPVPPVPAAAPTTPPTALPTALPTTPPTTPPITPPTAPTIPTTEVAPDLAQTRAQLAALGIPTRLLTELSSPEPLLALWDVVATLPEAQPPRLRPSATRGGALLVVVGAWSAARSAVEALLADLGATPDAVLSVGMTGDDLPAGRTVRSHAAAVDLVRSSRQQHDTTVLLVDPGLGMHSAARVAELVATVEPQYVVVAADAGADLGASLTALDALDEHGVAVDAIALDGAARAAAPAAVFEVPVPVSWVDGRPATPGAWIGLLMDVLTTRTAAAARSHRC